MLHTAVFYQQHLLSCMFSAVRPVVACSTVHRCVTTGQSGVAGTIISAIMGSCYQLQQNRAYCSVGNMQHCPPSTLFHRNVGATLCSGTVLIRGYSGINHLQTLCSCGVTPRYGIPSACKRRSWALQLPCQVLTCGRSCNPASQPHARRDGTAVRGVPNVLLLLATLPPSPTCPMFRAFTRRSGRT